MVDPLAEIVTLLQPAARFSKLVEGAGRWRVQRPATGEPFYGAILDGGCMLQIGQRPPELLQAGDFILVPGSEPLVNTSVDPPPAHVSMLPVEIGEGHFRVGRQDGPADVRMRGGFCSFGSPDAALLVSLLPEMVLVRGEARLATLVNLVGEETRARRPARDLVLERLLEVLLIEALRCGNRAEAAPGLARGLADDRLGAALRALHARPAHGWTVPELAQEASLSRSAFFARFNRLIGLAPMEYLLAWRMALARRLLRGREMAVEQVAEKVGYGSASAFAVAFARHVGVPPARYARSGAA